MLAFCTFISDLFHLDVSIFYVMIKYCFLDKKYGVMSCYLVVAE